MLKNIALRTQEQINYAFSLRRNLSFHLYCMRKPKEKLIFLLKKCIMIFPLYFFLFNMKENFAYAITQSWADDEKRNPFTMKKLITQKGPHVSWCMLWIKLCLIIESNEKNSWVWKWARRLWCGVKTRKNIKPNYKHLLTARAHNIFILF